MKESDYSSNQIGLELEIVTEQNFTVSTILARLI